MMVAVVAVMKMGLGVAQTDEPHLVTFGFFDGQLAGLRQSGDGALDQNPLALAFGALRHKLHQFVGIIGRKFFGAKRHQIKERAVTCRVHGLPLVKEQIQRNGFFIARLSE